MVIKYAESYTGLGEFRLDKSLLCTHVYQIVHTTFNLHP